MKSNLYLYGTGVKVEPIPKEIAEHRIKLLNNNLNVLLDVDYNKRDNVRVNDIMNAIKHWRKLRDGESI